ncbi:MAG: glycosyltransferase family 2 protein [Nitrospirota bacterium]
MIKNNSARFKKVGIIVLNFNGWQDTIECLESLQKIEYPDFLIIVVDNASSDGSIEKIKAWAEGKIAIVEYERECAEQGGVKELEEELQKYPNDKKIVLIKNNANLGFSGGNNVGAKYAYKKGCEYIGLLNNDTIILENEFINKLVEVFEYDGKVFAVGPKIVTPSGAYDGPYIYETFWGEVLLLTIRNQFNKLFKRNPIYIDMHAILSTKPVPVYKISGACMVFRASFLEETGYLDENVWLSCEEAIVAEKVLKNKGTIYFQPLTQIIHKRAQSPRKDKSRIGILKNHYRQRQYFLKTYRDYGFFKIGLIKLMHNLRLLFERVRA